MAKDSIKTISWNDVLDHASSVSGVPKKQLSDDTEIIVSAVEDLVKTHQPKKAGDTTEIQTPYFKLAALREPETTITDINGTKMIRPECVAVNLSVRASFVTAANIGLVDDTTTVKTA